MNNNYIRQALIDGQTDSSLYPFNIPAVRRLESLEFDQPVTFLVGENGSGKSTILESLAVLAGFNSEGGTKNYSFSTADTTSELHEKIRLVRGPQREKNGFFLRAESFYNVSTESEKLDLRYGDRSLHDQSHGESFLSLVNHRFGPNGLYILDEPEAALSPQRQLSLMARIHDLTKQNSQFIIASHSPILMAYPGAAIYLLDDEGISRTSYEQTEHYKLTLDFLFNHQAYVRKLLEE